MIASFDIDGVIFIGDGMPGIYPGPKDIIITGRSVEEIPETISMLRGKGINQFPFFNPRSYNEKTRESSGRHKGHTINRLNSLGFDICRHFDDDEIQAKEIKRICPNIDVIMVVHSLTNKENERHL